MMHDCAVYGMKEEKTIYFQGCFHYASSYYIWTWCTTELWENSKTASTPSHQFCLCRASVAGNEVSNAIQVTRTGIYRLREMGKLRKSKWHGKCKEIWKLCIILQHGKSSSRKLSNHLQSRRDGTPELGFKRISEFNYCISNFTENFPSVQRMQSFYSRHALDWGIVNAMQSDGSCAGCQRRFGSGSWYQLLFIQLMRFQPASAKGWNFDDIREHASKSVYGIRK